MTDPPHPPRPIVCVVGARPNYMKMAPLVRAFSAIRPAECGSGPYRPALRRGDERAVVRGSGTAAAGCQPGSGFGTHAVQTAEVMRRFEPLVDDLSPSCVVVVGDVNSTLACSLVAAKKGVPVVHVEAGLRSFDRGMPEGNQPRADRPDRRPSLHDGACCRRQPAAGGRSGGAYTFCRKRDDRFCHAAPIARGRAGGGAGRGGRCARRLGRSRRLRRGHVASTVECR